MSVSQRLGFLSGGNFVDNIETRTNQSEIDTTLLLKLRASAGQGVVTLKTPTTVNTADSYDIILPSSLEATNDRQVISISPTDGQLSFTNTGNTYSVKDFGAVGDGITDDTGAIQDCIDECLTNGGGTVYWPYGTYMISTPLINKVPIQLSAALTGNQLHFTEIRTMKHMSDSRAEIKASAAMAYMMSFIFNTTYSNVAPYYAQVEGIYFNGNSLATVGIRFDYAFHNIVRKCLFNNMATGILNAGYGVHQFLYNVFRCTVRGIYLEQGGDNLILHNDFFPIITSNNVCCIDVGTWGGNTNIIGNVMTSERDVTNVNTHLGIRLSGDYSLDGSREVRDCVILGNEFSGLNYGIYAVGHTSSNIYKIDISQNHVTVYSTFVNCALGFFNYVQNSTIQNNFVGQGGAATNSAGLEINNSTRMNVNNNLFNNLNQAAILIGTVTYSTFESNKFWDTGKAGAGFVVVDISGTSTNNIFRNNRFYASSATYANNGIYERAGGNNNLAEGNTFEGTGTFGTPYTVVGASSVMRYIGYGSAPPAGPARNYRVGDFFYDTSNAVNFGYKCITAGAPGTWQTIA